MHSFKKAAAGLMIAGLLAPVAAFADTSTSSQSLLDQVKALQAQIQSLQQQKQQVIAQLAVNLNQGSSGDQVKLLQQMLAQDPSVYPEGTISGYYGKLTAAAVKRFQKKHGLEQAGRVGPKTLAILNALFGGNASTSGSVGTTTGNNGNGNGNAQDDRNLPCAGHDNGLHLGWLIGKGNKDKDHDCGGNGQGTTTPPAVDTTAPVISAATITGITTTGATVTWTTNENASSQVEYGTTTSYGSLSALNGSLVTAHSVALTGLTAGTAYNVRIWTKDASNNTATSSNITFSTLALDTSAPIISSVSASSIATTTATVSWTTNENATGKVYFGTVNPLVLGSASTLTNATASTAHTFALSGLAASTTYYFVVESMDASNNTATSTQSSFTTTN